jgi:hypothetical protein
VTAGTGDDYIKVTGDKSTINFAKGDGNDVVRVDNGSGSVDFSISGYSLDDVIVTQQYGRTTINFKGSNDSLVFDHGSNGSARLSSPITSALIFLPDAALAEKRARPSTCLADDNKSRG